MRQFYFDVGRGFDHGILGSQGASLPSVVCRFWGPV